MSPEQLMALALDVLHKTNPGVQASRPLSFLGYVTLMLCDLGQVIFLLWAWFPAELNEKSSAHDFLRSCLALSFCDLEFDSGAEEQDVCDLSVDLDCGAPQEVYSG